MNPSGAEWLLQATGRAVCLRTLEESDLEPLYRLAVHPDVGRYWRYRGASVSRQVFNAELWNGGVFVHLVIYKPEDPHLPLGLVTGYDMSPTARHAKFAAVMDPSIQQTAAAGEAITLCLRLMFERWPLRKIYIESQSPAIARLGALTRLVDEEARYVDHDWAPDGSWVDLVVLAVWRHQFLDDDEARRTRSAWEARRQAVLGTS